MTSSRRGRSMILGILVLLLAVEVGLPLLLALGRNRLIFLPAAGTDFLPIAGAGHNDLFEVGGEEYLEALGRRFRSWVEAPGQEE